MIGQNDGILICDWFQDRVRELQLQGQQERDDLAGAAGARLVPPARRRPRHQAPVHAVSRQHETVNTLDLIKYFPIIVKIFSQSSVPRQVPQRPAGGHPAHRRHGDGGGRQPQVISMFVVLTQKKFCEIKKYLPSLTRTRAVERCHCPPGYTGLSCGSCDYGYTRVNNTLYR